MLQVLTGLEALLLTHLPGSATSLDKLTSTLDKLELISKTKLNVEGEVGLLAVKFSFIGLIHRQSYKEQGDLLRQMIRLEPSCGTWYFWLHRILNFERLAATWNCARISREEIDLIVKAIDLCPDNPLVIVALCETIAYVLRDHGPNWTGIESFGPGRLFYSSEGIVEFLATETRRALVLDPTSVRTNIAVAKIFSSAVPKIFFDFPFAKLCIERALLFHPNSSKANQRMGIYYLTVEKIPSEAIKYFERAYESDPRNAPGMLDLLLTYLSDLETYEDRIEQLIEKELQNVDKVAVGSRSRFYFAKGIYNFMKGNIELATCDWHLSVESYPQGIESFKKFGYGIFRYNLPKEKISTHLVIRELNELNLKENVQHSIRRITAALLEDLEKNERHGRGSRQERAGFGRRGFHSGFRGNHFRGSGFYGSEHWQHGHDFFGGKRGNGKHGQGDYSRENHEGESFKKTTTMDHYKILGVDRNAPVDKIKMAYRKLCLQYHPDKNSHLTGKAKEENLEQMKRINTAYAALAK